jgi:hypothetical protein
MTIKLAELLVRHGIVDDSAIEDPQGYDGGRTLRQIAELEKELNESQDVTPDKPTKKPASQRVRELECTAGGSVKADDVLRLADELAEEENEGE